MCALCLLSDANRAAPARPPQQPIFRATSETIALYATVRDSSGRFVQGLAADDFTVFEDGLPVDIVTFSSQPQPLSLSVMVDTSESTATIGMADVPLKDALYATIDQLGPSDRMRVGSFGLEIVVGAGFISDKERLKRTVERELWVGGGTPLWQALAAALETMPEQPPRRVLLAFTDGVNTGQLPGRRSSDDQVASLAESCECMLFFVLLRADVPVPRALSTLADRSGGGYARVDRSGDVTAAVKAINEELRQQYLIGVRPRADAAGRHSLRVDVRQPNATVRSRSSYVR